MHGPYRTPLVLPPAVRVPAVMEDDDESFDDQAVAGVAPNELSDPWLVSTRAPPHPCADLLERRSPLYRADRAARRYLVRVGLMRARFEL